MAIAPQVILDWEPYGDNGGFRAIIGDHVAFFVLREGRAVWRWALIAISPPNQKRLVAGAEGQCRTCIAAREQSEAAMLRVFANLAPHIGNA